MSLKFLFLFYAIMGGLQKAFAIFELIPRMFQFLCSILPIGGGGGGSVVGCDEWSYIACYIISFQFM